MSIAVTLWQAGPQLPVFQPIPPLSRNPLAFTHGRCPAGEAKPCGPSCWISSRFATHGSIAAVRDAGLIDIAPSCDSRSACRPLAAATPVRIRRRGRTALEIMGFGCSTRAHPIGVLVRCRTRAAVVLPAAYGGTVARQSKPVVTPRDVAAIFRDVSAAEPDAETLRHFGDVDQHGRGLSKRVVPRTDIQASSTGGR
jgi:hypothetical protein